MAVFYDTGGGDFYGGDTREQVLAEMRREMGDDYDESAVSEVPGTMQMRASGDDGEPTDELITLEEAYTPGMGAYCVASNNQ